MAPEDLVVYRTHMVVLWQQQTQMVGLMRSSQVDVASGAWDKGLWVPTTALTPEIRLEFTSGASRVSQSRLTQAELGKLDERLTEIESVLLVGLSDRYAVEVASF